MDDSQQGPAPKARRSLEDLLAALAEAIRVFVDRLREPAPQGSAAPAAPRDTSPPNRDYF